MIRKITKTLTSISPLVYKEILLFLNSFKYLILNSKLFIVLQVVFTPKLLPLIHIFFLTLFSDYPSQFTGLLFNFVLQEFYVFLCLK